MGAVLYRRAGFLSAPGVMGLRWPGCLAALAHLSQGGHAHHGGQQSHSRNREGGAQRSSLWVVVPLGQKQAGWPVSGALTPRTEGVTASQPMLGLHSPKAPE